MLRLLHLEDSRLDAELVIAALARAGLAVECDRVDARDAFVRAIRSSSYDAILCDYRVPGFDGEDALHIAQAERPDVPFVFVSGALGEHAAIDLLKRGATDYVLKDQLERLGPSVERALAEARERRDRRSAEAKLRDRERTLSTLMQNLPGMVFRTVRGGPWRFDFASEGCLALSGYPPETFAIGGTMLWDDIVHPDDARRVREESRNAYVDGEPFTTTYRITRRDGAERWLWARAVLVPSEAPGEPGHVEGFVTDVTMQKRAETELAQRIEFQQQLVGIVSHDLRNPLNAILLGANALLRGDHAAEGATRIVRRILASAERASRMIHDLLDFTQVRLRGALPVSPRRAELRAIASGVLEELEHARPDRRLELSAEPIDGEWDPDRIAQLLGNLVSNAIAYSPAGTPISVRIGGDATEAVLEVHNLGEPIPPSMLDHIFEPLTRGSAPIDRRDRSIGLGLFIVDNIVRAHGGTVAVRSNADEGTTFCVRLPRRPADPTARS